MGIADITRDRKSKTYHGAGGDKELEIGKPGLKWGVPGVESYKTFRILVEVEGEGIFIIRPPDGWWQVAAFL